MDFVAIIGGTGFDRIDDFHERERLRVDTPWGDPSGDILRGSLGGRDFLFLPRHGESHDIPPHRVNYRANIDALRSIGARRIIALAAVGGIHALMRPGDLVIPDQVIDYTWGRQHTFFDGDGSAVEHIDFTHPYTPALREHLLGAAIRAGKTVHDGGTYAVTQGPRLETAAEIDRLERDGADIVGMTGMPEAALAREAGIDYAAVAIVVNPAAGRGEAPITLDDIRAVLARGSLDALEVLRHC